MSVKIVINNKERKTFSNNSLVENEISINWKKPTLDRSKITDRMSLLNYLFPLSSADSDARGYETELEELRKENEKELEQLKKDYEKELKQIEEEYERQLEQDFGDGDSLSIITLNGDTLTIKNPTTQLIPKLVVDGKPMLIDEYDWFINGNRIKGAKLFLLISKALIESSDTKNSAIFTIKVTYDRNKEIEEEIQINNLIDNSSSNSDSDNKRSRTGNGNQGNGRNSDDRTRDSSGNNDGVLTRRPDTGREVL